MKTYRITALLMLVLLSSTIVSPAHAHPSSQSSILESTQINQGMYSGYYVGGPRVGWNLNEGYHIGGQTIKYKYAAGVSNTVKNAFNDAFDSWGNAGLQFQESSSAIGTIITFNNPNSNLDGTTTNMTVNSNGHFTSWEIQINVGHTVTAATCAHELGHVIGLCDQYSSTCKNKIMYYTSNGRTTNVPKAVEKRGAEVITGQHSSHSWQYRLKSTNPHKHEKYCTTCNGIKKNSAQNCTFDSNGVCTVCGIGGGPIINSTIDPIAAILPAWEEQKRSLISRLV